MPEIYCFYSTQGISPSCAGNFRRFWLIKALWFICSYKPFTSFGFPICELWV